MANFPEPPDPATLAARAPAETRTVAAGALLWRVYFRAGRHPTTWRRFRRFGPAGGRFDHHLPDEDGSGRMQEERAVLHAAERGQTCLAEVFQATRLIDRGRNEPWLVGFRLRRPVVLLDLTRNWPTRAGASATIASGQRSRARRWSQAVHEAFAKMEGLYYGSSMDASAPALALYERAEDAMPPRPDFHRALADPVLDMPLRNAAADLGHRLT